MTLLQKLEYLIGAYNAKVVALWMERLTMVERSSLLYEIKYHRGKTYHATPI